MWRTGGVDILENPLSYDWNGKYSGHILPHCFASRCSFQEEFCGMENAVGMFSRIALPVALHSFQEELYLLFTVFVATVAPRASSPTPTGSPPKTPAPPTPATTPPPSGGSTGTCKQSGSLTGNTNSGCNTENNLECCQAGQLYPQFSCSAAVTPSTPATLTLNGFGSGQDGGGASECDGKFHPEPEMVAALSIELGKLGGTIRGPGAYSVGLYS